VEKQWHRPYIYCGAHTLLTAYDPKPRDILTLGESDLAYIDIGPIITVDGVAVEGDVGKTFMFGENPLHYHLKQTSEEIFQAARNYWAAYRPTGVELYRYIHRLTVEAGLMFNLATPGHLIGSFPHLGWKQGLHSYPYPVEAGIWILEIQVRHPKQPYGAFYESLLI